MKIGRLGGSQHSTAAVSHTCAMDPRHLIALDCLGVVRELPQRYHPYGQTPKVGSHRDPPMFSGPLAVFYAPPMVAPVEPVQRDPPPTSPITPPEAVPIAGSRVPKTPPHAWLPPPKRLPKWVPHHELLTPDTEYLGGCWVCGAKIPEPSLYIGGRWVFYPNNRDTPCQEWFCQCTRCLAYFMKLDEINEREERISQLQEIHEFWEAKRNEVAGDLERLHRALAEAKFANHFDF